MQRLDTDLAKNAGASPVKGRVFHVGLGGTGEIWNWQKTWNRNAGISVSLTVTRSSLDYTYTPFWTQ